MTLSKLQQKKASNPGGFAFKNFDCEVKTLEGRRISGIAAVFNNIDRDQDRIHKGAFSKSIRERGPESAAKAKILMLWQHDSKDPIGRVVKLEETDEGLYFEGDLDEGIASADRALKQLESGTLNQFSIGFQYDWDRMEYNSFDNSYELFELILHEISPVSIAANPETYYMGLKSAEDVQAAELALSEQVNEFIKTLNISQQRIAGELFLRQKSLSSRLTASELKERLKQHTVENEAKSIFAGMKIKK